MHLREKRLTGRLQASKLTDLGEILEEHGIQRDKMSMQEMLRSGSSASQPNPALNYPCYPPPPLPKIRPAIKGLFNHWLVSLNKAGS